MTTSRPDVILVASEWPERALVRAELINAAFEVVALDAWPIPLIYHQPEMKPRALVVDLRGARDPRSILRDIPALLSRDRVLVLSSLGTVDPDEIRALGYHVMSRPLRVRDIVSALSQLIERDKPT